ncbi:MAG: C4-dicarboxylate ABC transporter substrate-binding protein [Rhizobiales bacterium]|nr:C4-dicarboxylate ABC transporter substrate-binding protein [Hyphomicrobiales bacterium]
MALAIAGAAGASTAHADKWDMPLAYAATNFHSENAAEFGKCVAGASGGAIDIVTHPSGSLFKGNEIWRAVQTGQAPIGERLISAHANENPLFGIDSVPFLASSFEESEKLWSVARDAVAQALDEKNLVLLYAVPWPPQGLYFKKSVASVADMKGVRFRSYNTATARLAELTGMLPVQVEAAELSQALATGVAESFISSGATGYDRKVWEHLTHFYEVDSWLPRNVVFVNKDVWNGLDDAKRKALTDCATTAASEGLKRSIAYTQFTLKGLREGGMTVGPASETLVKELKAIGVTMTEEWLKEAGDGGRAIVEAFRKM